MSYPSQKQLLPENIRKFLGKNKTSEAAEEALNSWLKASLARDPHDVESILRSLRDYLIDCDLISGTAYYLHDFVSKEVADNFSSSIKASVERATLHRLQLENNLLEKISLPLSDLMFNQDQEIYIARLKICSGDPKSAETIQSLASLTSREETLFTALSTALDSLDFGPPSWPQPQNRLNAANFRPILRDSPRQDRMEDFKSINKAIAEKAPSLFSLKKSSAELAQQKAKLNGHANLMASFLKGNQITLEDISSLREQLKNFTPFYEAFYRRQLQAEGIQDVHPSDVLFMKTGDIKLSFEEAIEALQEVANHLHPHFGKTVSALLENNTIRYKPEDCLSSSYYAMFDHKTGLSLIHAPFHGDAESLQALAHEIGHACHLNFINQILGPLSTSNLPRIYSETFSLLFEIKVQFHFLKNARSPGEEKLWSSALLGQALYYLRGMSVKAEFDLFYFSEENTNFPKAAKKWNQLEMDSYGNLFKGKDLNFDCFWILNRFQEQVPYFGFEYIFAYLMAFTMAINDDRSRISTFASSPGLSGPLEEFQKIFGQYPTAIEIDSLEKIVQTMGKP